MLRDNIGWWYIEGCILVINFVFKDGFEMSNAWMVFKIFKHFECVFVLPEHDETDDNIVMSFLWL